MFTCRDFKGKTALSTGPASGMRLLFPQSFAKLGGNVALCDVKDYKQVCLARDTAVKTFGLIDVMASFAGGTARRMLNVGWEAEFPHFPDKFMTNQMDLVQFEF